MSIAIEPWPWPNEREVSLLPVKPWGIRTAAHAHTHNFVAAYLPWKVAKHISLLLRPMWEPGKSGGINFSSYLEFVHTAGFKAAKFPKMFMYLFNSKLKQSSHGVWAEWENEDERDASVAIHKGLTQVEVWCFNEGTAQTVWNKLPHHGNNLEDKRVKGFYEGVRVKWHTSPHELTLSGLIQRITSILWNWLSFFCYSSWNGVWCGFCK